MSVPTPSDDGHLIVVSSLGAAHRRTFFETVSAHYPIWLFVGGPGRAQEPSWELPYVVGHTSVDTLDADAMRAAVRALPEHVRVRGIVCYDEARVVAAAKLATTLGLPAPDPDAVLRCRDKHLTRTALDAAGVPQAQSLAVRSLDEALAAAQKIGYPVVLKPRNLAASFGVTRADSDSDVAAAYAAAGEKTLPEVLEHHEDGVLVEEYLDGEEISIDSACFDGRIEPQVVAHKLVGYPPNFLEMGHTVSAGDPLLNDPEVREVVIGAHRAVGFDTGATHLELKLTSRGPRVVELNARLAGGLIPYLGRLTGGADLELAAATIACGEVPDLSRTDGAPVAAIRYFYPPHDLVVGELYFDGSALPASVERAELLTAPGEPVRLPPRGSAWESYLAQAVVTGETVSGCHRDLDAAGAAVVVVPA
ncbi:ATP-grasp domain-containing protein [Pseudonocardia sp. CA-107938]|uniref:ATP-grasp domain-containing protein n=1 Tax=Pseudonocardia sp. CA-107938 TaxID=3240021 RepID=UPI003D8F1593